MDLSMQEPAFSVEGMVISRRPPPEVVDSGRVRFGGGVHLCWEMWQLFRHLPFFHDLITSC